MMKALGIDLGGSHATLAVTEDQTILASETIDTDRARSLSAILPRMAEAVRALLQRTSVPLADCVGVALGFAGLVDSRAGRVLSTNAKYDDAPDIDIVAWGRASLGL